MASMDYEIDVIDVITAFLLSKLDEEIYIKIPDGYPRTVTNKTHVLKLNKALYGLKQAPLGWNTELDKHLKSIGFIATVSDCCFYYRTSDLSYLIVWVDDFILATKNVECMVLLKQEIDLKFPCKDKGPISIYLNMHINRNRTKRTINLTQPVKISNVLTDPQLSSEEIEIISRPNKVPALATIILNKEMEPKSEEEISKMSKKPYRSILGQLLYISITTRPDIATAVSCCGKFAQNPGEQHWNALLLILRYLQGTRFLTLTLGGIFDEFVLSTFCDSDWASDQDNRRSRSGYIILMNGSPIHWSSKLQKSVSLSSTEAEYICLSAGTTATIFIRTLLSEIGFTQKSATEIIQDNQSTIKIAESRKQQPGIKHIDIRHHFVRDKIQSKEIKLVGTGTNDMLADIFTKNLPFPKYSQHRKNLMLEFPAK